MKVGMRWRHWALVPSISKTQQIADALKYGLELILRAGLQLSRSMQSTFDARQAQMLYNNVNWYLYVKQAVIGANYSNIKY